MPKFAPRHNDGDVFAEPPKRKIAFAVWIRRDIQNLLDSWHDWKIEQPVLIAGAIMALALAAFFAATLLTEN